MKDVIIIGGSFAGLATAYFTDASSILILEKKKEIGAAQKSTCCTTVEWIEKLKCERSILKTFNTLTLHSSSGHEATVELPVPFCTIDYKIFCKSLAENLENTEIITSSRVTDIDSVQKRALTENREYSGEILVDSSGWRGGAGNNPGFGIETETEYCGDTSSIHIYYGKKFIGNGYAWVFPTGEKRARIGLGCYVKSNLSTHFKEFLKFLNVQKDSVHGGYIPCFGLGEPTVGNAFVVGDASRNVLPLSGEGIRKSFQYAELCGRLITRVLRGELGLSEALKIYRTEVYKSRQFYDNLYFIQKISIYVPEILRNIAVEKISKLDSSLTQQLVSSYLNDGFNSSKLSVMARLSKIFTN